MGKGPGAKKKKKKSGFLGKRHVIGTQDDVLSRLMEGKRLPFMYSSAP